jgi:acetylornithine deacetylase
VTHDLAGRAEAAIDPERLTATLAELVGIRSENPFGRRAAAGEGEADVATYLAGRFEKLGMPYEVRTLDHRRQNIIARWPESGPGARTIMLAGHMDTVRTDGYPDAYGPVVRGGRLHGRGSADMKCALACYLELLEAFREVGARLQGGLVIAGVADEEHEQRGGKDIGARGPLVDGVVIGEPTGLAVCSAAKGLWAAHIDTAGRAVHTSVEEVGVNAIVHMARVITEIDRHAERLRAAERRHPLLGTARINPGVVSGGIQVNIVPDHCRLEISRRLLPGDTDASVAAEVQALLDRVAAGTPDFRATLRGAHWIVDAYEAPGEADVVTAMRRSLASLTGRDPGLAGFAASSDAAYFGSPVVICGPGALQRAHTTDEWVAVDDLVLAARAYLRTVLTFLAGPAPDQCGGAGGE